MKTRFKPFLFSFLVSPLSFSADGININNFPHYLGTAFGTSDFVGGIMASLILLTMVMLPILAASKGRNVVVLTILFGNVVLGLCVALGWFPVWLFAVEILAIAFGFASFMGDQLGGGRKGSP